MCLHVYIHTHTIHNPKTDPGIHKYVVYYKRHWWGKKNSLVKFGVGGNY